MLQIRCSNKKRLYARGLKENIALIEGIQTKGNHGANDIGVFTNSKLVCNQMKGTYKVKKEHLKLLYREARIIASQFDSFTINHHRNTDRMSNDPFSRAMPTLIGGGEK